ncbi:MAG: cytochrome c biogenesis protein ResB [Dethiobacteraceae bacterium]
MVKEVADIPEEQQLTPESPVKQILSFLGSMQLGIILLLLLSVITLFATFRPMQLAIEYVYNSWWFLGIMAFAGLNLFICTVERCGPLSRLALRPKKTMSLESIKKMQINAAIKLTGEPLAKAEKAFKKAGLRTVVTATPEGPVLFGEKGKFGYFGSIVTHFSLLLILLAAAYGSLTGFKYDPGPYGYAGSNFFVPEGRFRVDITDVRMVQNENPVIRPRVYTEMTITRDGRTIVQDSLSINYPIRFEGTTIYHSTFLYRPEIALKNTVTDESNAFTLTEPNRYMIGYQRINLGDQVTNIALMGFYPNFSMGRDGRPFSLNNSPERPVAAVIIMRDGQREASVFLQLNEPEVVETAAGDVEVLLTGFDVASVYSISKNLGRPYLFIGSVLMTLGLYMSFFLFPSRFWAVYDEGKRTLFIGGRGYRNRIGTEQALEKIEEEIKTREEE